MNQTLTTQPAALEDLSPLRAEYLRLKEKLQLINDIALLKTRLLKGPEDDESQLLKITELVCADYNVPVATLHSRCRNNETSSARHIICWLGRELLDMKCARLGRLLKRDHGSVIHAWAAINDRCSVDTRFTQRLARLKHECRAALKL